ncbi:MAG: hypothetical protein ACYTGQ_18830, partial [Planctomycetota bacterium]
MTTRTESSRHAPRQGGFALLLVLIAVGIAMTLALGFVGTQSTAVGVMSNIEDHTQARYIAESGLAMGAYYIESDANWRTDQTEGTWVTDQAYGGGTFTLRAADGNELGGDGDLADDTSDQVFLTSVGRFGTATHTVHQVITPTTGAGGGALLLIVNDPDNLSGADTQRVNAMADIGWSATPFAAAATPADLAAAAAEHDVVYVTQPAASAQLGANLLPLATGVVSENAQASIDMQMVVAFRNLGGTQIEIFDNTHYISQPFALGALPIFSLDAMMHRVDTLDYATGARKIAVKFNKTEAALLAVDLGAGLLDGSAARGRRVHLPWSRGDTDLSTLTADGENLLKRALEWAAVSRFLAASSNGIMADTTVQLNGNALVDSFDSTEGAYGGANVSAEAVVTSNASTPGGLAVGATALIDGFAMANPTSTITGAVPTQIRGGVIQLAE